MPSEQTTVKVEKPRLDGGSRRRDTAPDNREERARSKEPRVVAKEEKDGKTTTIGGKEVKENTGAKQGKEGKEGKSSRDRSNPRSKERSKHRENKQTDGETS